MRSLVQLAACGAIACQASNPAPPAEPAAADSNPFTACFADFKPTGNPRHDMKQLTDRCGHVGGMRPITPVHTARQRDSDPADRYTFYVPTAGGCYRVYATSGRNVGDLDLLLRGPTPDLVIADLTSDTWPVLPARHPVCFEQPGLYMLEVSVGQGTGEYALQVWSNQPHDGRATRPRP